MQQTVILTLAAMAGGVALVLVAMGWRALRRAARSRQTRMVEWGPQGPQLPR